MSISRLRWTRILPELDLRHPIGKPSGRSSHGVSWIQSTSRLVIHGGERIPRTPLEDHDATWVCDFAGDDDRPERGRWRAITGGGGTGSPPVRLGHAQASHAGSSSVYVFGGRSGIGMREEARNDMWKLDCSGPPGSETWSEVTPEGDGPVPEARSFHRMVCLDDSLYVFGGCGTESGRLSDLHRFDIPGRTWHDLGSSHHLRGRGGAALLPLDAGNALGVVAGFAGEETNDGHVFRLGTGRWAEESLTDSLRDLRPRSVCVGGSFPAAGVSVVFGGEVEPSAMDHEGAGGFENDIVLLEEATGKHLETVPQPQPHGNGDEDPGVPEPRGWSDGAVALDERGGSLFVFGGLTGDDAAPKRLDDLWKLTVSTAA